MRKVLGCCVVLSLCFFLPPAETSTSKSFCSATAWCSNGSTVSCNGTSTCQAVDRNCSSGQRGYVSCDGTRTFCEECPVDPPDPCAAIDQQYPGCGYVYDPVGQCCNPTTQSLSCPYEPCLAW